MRRVLAGAVLLFGVLVAPAGATGHEISIHDTRFDPDFVSVATGDTVTWVNDDDISHTVTSDDDVFDSRQTCGGDTDPEDCTLEPGDEFTPDDIGSLSPGDYPYHCEIHASMHGLLTVRAPATTTSSTTTTTRPTTTTSSTTTTTTLAATTTTLATTVTTEAASSSDDGGGGGLTWLIVALIVVVLGAIIATGTYMYRNRDIPEFDDRPPGPPGPPKPRS